MLGSAPELSAAAIPSAPVAAETASAFASGPDRSWEQGRAIRDEVRRWFSWVITGLSLVLPAYLVWLAYLPMLSAPLGYDEQFFTWTGWSVLKGLAPYKEFIEYKPPVLFLTHALALKVFGLAGMKFRLFFFGLVVGSLAAVQLSLLSRRVNRGVALALVLGASLLVSNYHDTSFADAETPGYAYYMFALAALLVRTRHRNVMDAVGGAFLTLCVFTKEPFLPSVLGAWLAAFAVMQLRGTWKQEALRYSKFTGLGALVVVVTLSLYMIPTGAMWAYIKTVWSYRWLFRDPTKGYCVILNRFHPSGSVLADLPRQWDVIHEAFFNTRTLGWLAPAFAGSLVFLARRSPVALAAGLLSLAGGLYAVTASNCYWSHYYIMAQTGVFCFLFVGAIASVPALGASPPATRVWAGLLMLASVGIPVYDWYEANRANVHRTAPDSEPIPGVVDFVRTHSSPTDRIFTTGAPGLYMLTDRIHSTKESSMIDEILESLPGRTDEEKVAHLREQLVRARPKIVIMDPEHGDRKRRHDKALVEPFVAEFGYQKVGPYYYVRP